MKCPDCQGFKTYLTLAGDIETCPKCQGKGYIEERKVGFFENLLGGGIHKRTEEAITRLEHDLDRLREDKEQLDELIKVAIDNENTRILLHSLGLSSPIMMWAKSVEGKYLYANKALADHLFYGNADDLIGRDDMQIADIVRQTYPEHNFGSALCLNSDADCLEKNQPMKYMEFGVIRDSYRYVIAYKSPFYDKNGKVLGTCGVARYCDEEVLFLQDIVKTTNCEKTRAKTLKYLEKYMFADSEPVELEYDSKLNPEEEAKMTQFREEWYKRSYL